MHHKHHEKTTWTERTKPASAEIESSQDSPHHAQKQAFSHPHTSLGVAGHLIHMAGVFVPLVAGELVTDAVKYKKTVRLASIGTAMAYEIVYVVREQQRKSEQAAKLAECRGRE